LFIPFKV